MSRARHILAPHVATELASARAAGSRDVAAAWRHLERAHILSQPSAWQHTRVHWSMIVLAVRTKDVRELFGQLVRIAVAGLGSAVGRYPRGNTGRARAPINEPMPIPDDLLPILSSAADAQRLDYEANRTTRRQA
jgi:hypothetical protein